MLDVKTYNKLRDFKKEIEAGNTFYIYKSRYDSSEEYITESEAVENIAKECSDLNKEIDRLNIEILYLNNPESKKITVNDVKKMSLLKFYKWRKS